MSVLYFSLHSFAVTRILNLHSRTHTRSALSMHSLVASTLHLHFHFPTLTFNLQWSLAFSTLTFRQRRS